MIQEESVIKYLRQKGSGTTWESPTWLGAKQRFVEALRNSSLNNLEEQYVLGTDTYTESYEEDDKLIIIKSFCATDNDLIGKKDYYRIVTTYYGINNSDYFFDENYLSLSNKLNDSFFGNASSVSYPDPEMIYFLNKNGINTFSSNEESLTISPSTYTIEKVDELYFVKNTEGLTDPNDYICKKITGIKRLENGHIIRHEEIVI